MVIGIIGENCTGKSTVAEHLKSKINAQVFTGKDYLRLAKSEEEAKRLFREKLNAAVDGEDIIFVIAESELLKLLPDDAIRILVTADIEVIKERFAKRMNGRLPEPVAKMLEKKHGCFDSIEYDIHVDFGNGGEKACEEAINQLNIG